MKRALLSGLVVAALPTMLGFAAEPNSKSATSPSPPAAAPIAVSHFSGPTEPITTAEPTTTAEPAKESIAARATALLQQTAAALQSQSIEPAEESAFRGLLAASEELKADKTLAPSERERLRALARVRLRHAADVLAKQTARAARIAKDEAAKKPASDKPATVETPQPTTLAQQFQLGGGGQGGFLAGAGGGNTPGGNRAAELESAKQLMDVITSTIQPESWEEVGGKGVIRYWTLGSALIIRNTSDVHGAVGDVIRQLRN